MGESKSRRYLLKCGNNEPCLSGRAFFDKDGDKLADKTTQEIVLKVTGDTKDGERKVKSLLDMLKSGKISVDLDTKGLSSSVDRARKLLDDKLLNRKNKISVDLDLGKMQEQLKSLASKTQTVKVGVDIAGADRKSVV